MSDLPSAAEAHDRLNTLRSLAPLEPHADATLEGLVRLAAHAWDCPVAAVFVEGPDRHWAVAAHGVEAGVLPVDLRFHVQTARQGGVLVVRDVALDPVLGEQVPWIAGWPLRFFAGATIRVDGHVVGTLCLGAPQPRSPDPSKVRLLTDLADGVAQWFLRQREWLQLCHREREHRALLDQMPGIVYRAALDPTRSMLYVSSRLRRLGYEPEQWLAQPEAWADALHPEDRGRVLDELARCRRAGEPFDLCYRLRAGDGHWRLVRDSGGPVPAGEERGGTLQGVILDLTEALTSEAVSAHSVLRALPLAVLQLDAEGAITDANFQAEHLLGLTRVQLQGRELAALRAGDASMPGGLRRPVGDGRVVEWDYWHPAGRLRAIEERRQRLADGVEVVVLTDASHRRDESNWLRRLSQAAEQASEAIVITDLAANIEYVNQAMVETSGYARDELIGRNSRLLQSGLTPTSRYRDLWLNLMAGKPWRGFFNNRRKDGSHYIEFAVITPVRDTAGRITHFLAVKEDVTEKRRMGEDLRRYREHLDELVAQRTQELERAKQMAETASHAKSAFLATMSHEIRTPMNGVIGIADVLQLSTLDAHQQDLVDTIRESAQALLTLIDDILDFSKIEAGRLELAPAPFELRRVLEKTCDALQPVASARGVRLHAFVDPGLDPRWMGDASRVRQIVLNLVGNAIKFSSGLERPGRVSLRAQPAPGGGLRLLVRDNGIGMSGEVRQRIFRPFVQGEASTTRQYGGTGLGLAICQRLVGAMGGSIVVQSEAGRGSSFIVDLPLKPLVTESEPPLADLTGVQCHLLYDDTEVLADWSAYLHAAGAQVHLMAPDTATWPAAPAPSQVLIVPESMGLWQTPGPGMATVLLRWQPRDLPRRLADDRVALSIDGLHRDDLVQAVAMASGRQPATGVGDSDAGQGGKNLLDAGLLDLQALVGERCVLVAEDNDINQKVVRHQLDRMGLRSEVVSDGQQALACWRREPARYALLLTDLYMPGLDGLTLARTIRAEEAAARSVREPLPIVALTANALGSEGERCLEAGMNAYLTKPVAMERLQQVMAGVFARDMGGQGRAMPTAEAVVERPDKVYDPAVLPRLVGDDPQVLQELRQQFMANADRALAEVERGVETQDWKAVGATAHRVKSSARATGAMALGDLFEQLEAAVREGRSDVAAELAGQVSGAVARLRERVEPLLGPASAESVLCVDDEPSVLTGLLAAFQAVGGPLPQTFLRGSDLLEHLPPTDTRRVLLLLDLLMPQMDGLEVIRCLGERRFEGAVVLLCSARSRLPVAAEHLLRAHGIRSLGVLHKPVDADALRTVLKHWRDAVPL